MSPPRGPHIPRSIGPLRALKTRGPQTRFRSQACRAGNSLKRANRHGTNKRSKHLCCHPSLSKFIRFGLFRDKSETFSDDCCFIAVTAPTATYCTHSSICENGSPPRWASAFFIATRMELLSMTPPADRLSLQPTKPWVAPPSPEVRAPFGHAPKIGLLLYGLDLHHHCEDRTGTIYGPLWRKFNSKSLISSPEKNSVPCL